MSLKNLMPSFGKGKGVSARSDVRSLGKVFPVDREKLQHLVNYEMSNRYRVKLDHEYLFLKNVTKVYMKWHLEGKDPAVQDFLQDQPVRNALLNLWTDLEVRDSKRILLPLRNAGTNPLRGLCIEIIKNIDMVLPDGAQKPRAVQVEFIGVDGNPVNVVKIHEHQVEEQALPAPAHHEEGHHAPEHHDTHSSEHHAPEAHHDDHHDEGHGAAHH